MLSLESIELFETKGVTDTGLANLAGLLHLREIHLSGLPNVTFTGTRVFPAHVRVEMTPEALRLELSLFMRVPLHNRAKRMYRQTGLVPLAGQMPGFRSSAHFAYEGQTCYQTGAGYREFCGLTTSQQA